MSRCLPALLERALQMNSDVRVRALLCRHTSCCTNGARVHVRTTDAVSAMSNDVDRTPDRGKTRGNARQ